MIFSWLAIYKKYIEAKRTTTKKRYMNISYNANTLILLPLQPEVAT